jgi:hypothetical protein
MDNFLFTLRIPFFLFGAVLCLAFDVIRFPVIIAFHIVWTVWVVFTRMLGFPFRLLFAAWKNDPTLLTSGLEEKFWRIARGWSIVFSNYFGSFKHLVDWQWNGGNWRPNEHAHFLRAQVAPRKRRMHRAEPREERIPGGRVLDLNARRPLSDSGD